MADDVTIYIRALALHLKGATVRLLHDTMAIDEHDVERAIPTGSIGIVTGVDWLGIDTDQVFLAHVDAGAHLVYDATDIHLLENAD